jgi:hypothetical protein
MTHPVRVAANTVDPMTNAVGVNLIRRGVMTDPVNPTPNGADIVSIFTFPHVIHNKAVDNSTI